MHIALDHIMIYSFFYFTVIMEVLVGKFAVGRLYILVQFKGGYHAPVLRCVLPHQHSYWRFIVFK